MLLHDLYFHQMTSAWWSSTESQCDTQLFSYGLHLLYLHIVFVLPAYPILHCQVICTEKLVTYMAFKIYVIHLITIQFKTGTLILTVQQGKSVVFRFFFFLYFFRESHKIMIYWLLENNPHDNDIELSLSGPWF